MIIYGKQVCFYALEHKEEEIQTVYVAKKGILPQPLFHKYHDKIKFLEPKWAQAMAKGGNHQGILVEINPFVQTTDVGNIGAIVRSAYALGAGAIIASGVKQLNFAAIARTSAGALLDMPFMVSDNILDNINELKQVGYHFYGASMDGEAVQGCSFAPKRVLVMGSEDKGLSKKVLSKIDTTVSITMQHAFDSLNVSAAAAILIHRMVYAVK